MEQGMKVRQYKFHFGEIGLDPASIYHMVKLEQEDENDFYHTIIREELENAQDLCAPEGGFRLIEGATAGTDTLALAGRVLNVGKNISGYLKKADSAAVFVCTAGKGIGDRARQLMAEGKLLEGYIADVIGSLAVETAMDRIAEKLQQEVEIDGYSISNRYSPGYCNWDVSDQQTLFSLLPEGFCGITLTESSLMRPMKSVSGVIGIGRELRHFDYACGTCTNTTCIYRNLK